VKDPMPGELVRHYKGGVYLILAEAIHTEQLVRLIIYRKVGEDQTWARPMDHFCGDVVTEGVSIERFIRLGGCNCVKEGK
jgi:hypothetical protein